MKVRIALTGLAIAASTLALSPAVSAAPVPQDIIGIGNLDPIVDSGTGSSAKATATFILAVKGQATHLQVLTIKSQVWKTIASGKQDATGKTVFSISDPLEVLHEYRAISGTPPTVSNIVKYQAGSTTKNTGLSTVYFNSNDGESVNTRKKYFDGEFSMTGRGGCGAVAAQKKAEMKGRGNYSWSFPKKSFTLKLDKKLNLCGMGESKKWALVANHYDKSLLRTAAAFDIGSKLTNLAWTPSARPVDVYVNGSYRGSYDLVERITAASGRINVPELKNDTPANKAANNVSPNVTGGYILEWDYRKGADHNVTAGGRGWVGIKEPEDEGDGSGITSAQINYINSYVDSADQALFGAGFKNNSSGWRKYIDINSAVDYYIGQELMKPVDGNMWASVYMYKQRSGKLFFGPMWDYDLAAGSANRAGNAFGTTGWYLRNPINISAKQSTKTWFNRLNEDEEFRSAVRSRWNSVHSSLKSNDAFLGAQRSLVAKSANENFKKWNVKEHLSTSQVVKGSWSAEVSYLRSWLNSRISWMNGQL
ncbi:MAG: CotH kinase family protein [Actinomycetota bacterium]|nr:CotH kinase family protein [Actinomycetota bacterium]